MKREIMFLTSKTYQIGEGCVCVVFFFYGTKARKQKERLHDTRGNKPPQCQQR